MDTNAIRAALKAIVCFMAFWIGCDDGPMPVAQPDSASNIQYVSDFSIPPDMARLSLHPDLTVLRDMMPPCGTLDGPCCDGGCDPNVTYDGPGYPLHLICVRSGDALALAVCKVDCGNLGCDCCDKASGYSCNSTSDDAGIHPHYCIDNGQRNVCQ